MICYQCHQKFYIKRSFLTLFETKKYYLCDQCRANSLLSIKISRVPLENHELVMISLFKNSFHLNMDFYSTELSMIVETMIDKHHDYVLIYFDDFVLTDFKLEMLSFLADSMGKGILLIAGMIKN